MHNAIHDRTLSCRVYPAYCFVDMALGGVKRRGNVISIDDLDLSQSQGEIFVSQYRFQRDYLDLRKSTGSVSGAAELACCGDFLWFDIDSDDLEEARIRTSSLIIRIEMIDSELSKHINVYYSGKKGFHVAIPSFLFGFEPSVDLPKLQRQAALKLAGDILIDTAIYESNRLWRVPNTLHAGSGLFKTRLTFDQLAQWSIKKILELAAKPLGKPYLPMPENDNIGSSSKLIDFLRESTEIRVPMTEGASSKVDKPHNWVADTLQNLHSGNRNDSFTRITGRLIQAGLSG